MEEFKDAEQRLREVETKLGEALNTIAHQYIILLSIALLYTLLSNQIFSYDYKTLVL